VLSRDIVIVLSPCDMCLFCIICYWHHLASFLSSV